MTTSSLLNEVAFEQLEQLPLGILCFDASATAIYCNSLAAEAFGMSLSQLLEGKWEDCGWRLLPSPPAVGSEATKACLPPSGIQAELRRIVRNDLPCERTLCREASTGERRWLHLSIRPFDFQSGAETGLIISVVDVTKTIQTRNVASQVEAKWREASQAKSDFIANLSHEIRTPLTAILGFAELLASPGKIDALPTVSIDCVEPLLRNAKHILKLVDDALDLVKIEAGQLAIKQEPMDFDKTLHDIAHLMSASTDRKKIYLRMETTTPVPAVVHTDETRFRQIMHNLLGNAIKFTGHGGVDVRVGYQAASEHTGRLKISVCDTGIGMDETARSQLFRRFARVSRTSKEFAGSGLGLQISQDLARVLGGRIRVKSRLGRGSLFRLNLPVIVTEETQWNSPTTIWPSGPHSRAAIQPTIETEGTPATPPDLQKPLDGMRVFLAEDGVDNQLLLSHLLRLAGAQVTVFDDGNTLLQSFADNSSAIDVPDSSAHCDLIVTDMLMPNMDGYEMVATLRDQGCELPIVALTANAMKGDAERCLLSGCDAYASKPIDRQQFIDTCTRCLLAKRNSHDTGKPNSPNSETALRPASHSNEAVPNCGLRVAH